MSSVNPRYCADGSAAQRALQRSTDLAWTSLSKTIRPKIPKKYAFQPPRALPPPTSDLEEQWIRMPSYVYSQGPSYNALAVADRDGRSALEDYAFSSADNYNTVHDLRSVLLASGAFIDCVVGDKEAHDEGSDRTLGHRVDLNVDARYQPQTPGNRECQPSAEDNDFQCGHSSTEPSATTTSHTRSGHGTVRTELPTKKWSSGIIDPNTNSRRKGKGEHRNPLGEVSTNAQANGGKKRSMRFSKSRNWAMNRLARIRECTGQENQPPGEVQDLGQTTANP